MLTWREAVTCGVVAGAIATTIDLIWPVTLLGAVLLGGVCGHFTARCAIAIKRRAR